MRDLVLWTIVLALVGLIGIPLGAQEASEDQEAVSMMATHWAEAWNRDDAKAIGDMYTDDADYMDFTGQGFQGREAIEKSFADLMSTQLKGTKISIQLTSTRFIKPDLAVGDSAWEITGLPETEGEAPPSKGTATIVAVKQNGQWLITSHRSRIPAAPPEADR